MSKDFNIKTNRIFNLIMSSESTLKRKEQDPVDCEKENIINPEEERDRKRSKSCEIVTEKNSSSSDSSSSSSEEDRCDNCNEVLDEDCPFIRCSGMTHGRYPFPCPSAYCLNCNEDELEDDEKIRKCRFCKEIFCPDCYEYYEHPNPNPENGPCDIEKYDCTVCKSVVGIEDIIICGGVCGEVICCKICVSKVEEEEEERPVKCSLCNITMHYGCFKEEKHYPSESKECEGKDFLPLLEVD